MSDQEKDKYFYFKLNKEKKVVRKQTEFEHSDFYGDFKQIKEFIAEKEKEFGDKPNVRCYFTSDYDGCIYFKVTWEEMENDDDFETRCQKEYADMLEMKRRNREYDEKRRIKRAEKKARSAARREENNRQQNNLTNLLIKSKEILKDA